MLLYKFFVYELIMSAFCCLQCFVTVAWASGRASGP